MDSFKNPKPTVDILILVDSSRYREEMDQFLVIKRKNPPYGWALPGGFVNEGESFEAAAKREALEETSLRVQLLEQFYTYSDPKRDPRQHNTSTVYIAQIPYDDEDQEWKAADDATEIQMITFQDVIDHSIELAFDHRQIVLDILNYHLNGDRPKPE